ncbi:MAG TPA: hypothetical protein VNW52_07575, partial [Burkholderiaceae bacterium]|nr:hypothetical protein [Burkholderiaceae bacterium]
MRSSYWFTYLLFRFFIASMTYLCCTLSAQATVIEAEGVAKIEFKTLVSQTRELAIQDAKDHALMQANS